MRRCFVVVALAAGVAIDLAVAHVAMLLMLTTDAPRPFCVRSYAAVGPVGCVRKALWRERCYALAREVAARDRFGGWGALTEVAPECSRGAPGTDDDWGMRFGWRLVDGR